MYVYSFISQEATQTIADNYAKNNRLLLQS